MAKEEATLYLKIKEIGTSVFNKITGGLGFVAKAAVATGSALAAFAAWAIKSYGDQEEALNKLNRALINQGMYSKQISETYSKYSNELQKITKFSDENIISAQATLQAHIGQIPITRKLTEAILDYAQATGKDAVAAASAIGKSIGSNVNAMARDGIAIDASASKYEKLAQVLDGIKRKWDGQAAAAAKGVGSLASMRNAISDVGEAFGERLAPVIELVSKVIINFSDGIKSTSRAVDHFITAIQIVISTASILKNILFGLGEFISTTLFTILEAVSYAMVLNFEKANEALINGSNRLASDLVDRWRQSKDEISTINNAFLDNAESKNKKELEMEEQSRIKKAEIMARELEDKKAADAAAQKSADEAAQEAANKEKQAALDRMERDKANRAAIAEIKNTIKAEEEAAWAVKSEEDILKESMKNDAELQALIMSLNSKILAEQDFTTKMDLERQKRQIIDAAMAAQKQKTMTDTQKMQAAVNSQEVSNLDATFSRMSQMRDSNNKAMVAVGKAAAIAHITIDTAQGATAAIASFAFLGPIGTALGYAAAGAIIAYGAEQISRVNSTKMADGGIIQATSGGVLATIGEGGKDEAIIPLDDERAKEALGGGGSTYNITVYGGMLGDEQSAREFAVAVDLELLKLRRSNQSVAFDSGVT